MAIPDRLSALIDKVEAGQPVTQSDLNRVATLQALDLAKSGRDFVTEMAERDRQHSELLKETTK